jgi:hypothetical protein
MVRNPLCHGRNVQTLRRSFSRNRDVYGRHISLRAIRTNGGQVSEHRAFVQWFAHTAEFLKSFGGRLALIRAMQACNPERRAWSSAEELDWRKESDFGDAPSQAQSINALPLSARAFRAGRGRGEWGQAVFGAAVR